MDFVAVQIKSQIYDMNLATDLLINTFIIDRTDIIQSYDVKNTNMHVPSGW